MNSSFIDPAEMSNGEQNGIPAAGRISYIDEIQNDASDIAEIKKAEERKISPTDRKQIALLSWLNIAVMLFLGIYLVSTGGGNAYDAIKGKSAFNMKTPYYDPATVFEGVLTPNLNVMTYSPQVQNSFKALLSENSDTVGWVSIGGTGIDYVVTQAQDNVYYERKNFEKEYSIKGIIFMDYRNRVAASHGDFSKNTVLYGHHVEADGTMFTSLEKYQSIDYYREHPIIEYNTIYGNFKWKIIGAFINYPNAPEEGEDLFYYWYTDFCDENTVAFANEVATRSYFINTSVDVRPSDKFLTLSTCTYLISKTGKVKGRFVVVARLVRDGEKETVNTDKAYVNENQRMPGLWYSSRDLEDPYKDVPVWAAY